MFIAYVLEQLTTLIHCTCPVRMETVQQRGNLSSNKNKPEIFPVPNDKRTEHEPFLIYTAHNTTTK